RPRGGPCPASGADTRRPRRRSRDRGIARGSRVLVPGGPLVTKHQWRKDADDYPIVDAAWLDSAHDAKLPAVLLGEGDRPDALKAPSVAIVGTRAATPLGIADARQIGAFCARAGITVISGLAIGIDAAAHE